ncbi:MAG: hypothetical protein SOY17_12520 [Evtepia sp.]|nr:hypothetical protein [Evtepia sp.]
MADPFSPKKKDQKELSFATNLLLLQGFAPDNERVLFIEDWYDTILSSKADFANEIIG